MLEIPMVVAEHGEVFRFKRLYFEVGANWARGVAALVLLA